MTTKCGSLSGPMFEDQFRFTCTRKARHTGLHSMEHDGQVIQWEHYDSRVIVPKPPIILMPGRVEGGREDFWRELGQANYICAAMQHEEKLPKRKRLLGFNLPDGSTWVDHMWKLTPGTKVYAHTDDWTVFMVAETPVSVIIWTCERLDVPLVYGGDAAPRSDGGKGPAFIDIGGEGDMLHVMKILARRHGELASFKGKYVDGFMPALGCRS